MAYTCDKGRKRRHFLIEKLDKQARVNASGDILRSLANSIIIGRDPIAVRRRKRPNDNQ